MCELIILFSVKCK